jgi:hypothetical protein
VGVSQHLTGHKPVGETGNGFQKTNAKLFSPAETDKPLNIPDPSTLC